MSERWKNGSTRAWRQVRARVLARDGGRCRLKLPGCATVATQVHHTRARELVGDDPAHLVSACQPCNGRAGDPTTSDPAPSYRDRWWDRPAETTSAAPSDPSSLSTTADSSEAASVDVGPVL